jgi:hypothetical protein
MKRLFGFAILTLAMTVMAQAQYRPSGPPASVTSPNPNTGSVFNGAGPTVTSGSFGPAVPLNLARPQRHGAFGRGHHHGAGGHGRFGTPFAPLWAYSPTLVPVPVPVDADGNPIAPTDPQAAEEEEDDRPAYTVFEHRNRVAIPPTDAFDRRSNTQAEEAPEPVVQDQPATLLIFRDGHQLEITNYAIQSGTLFNLSDNGPRKIALADLDVDKTVKANDERGVDFTVPATR